MTTYKACEYFLCLNTTLSAVCHNVCSNVGVTSVSENKCTVTCLNYEIVNMNKNV